MRFGRWLSDRLHADEKFRGNSARILPLGDKSKNLPLTPGAKIRSSAGHRIRDGVAEQSGAGRAEGRAAVRAGLEPLLGLKESGGFSRKPCASASSVSRRRTGFSGPEQTSTRDEGDFLLDAPMQVDAVGKGHFAIENHDIRVLVEDQQDGGLAVSGFVEKFVTGFEADDFRAHFAAGGLLFGDAGSLHVRA